MNQPVHVIYIAGSGRSGSTVLNTVLGTHPGVFGAGELQNIGRVWSNNEFCSCGERAHDCPFWSKVMTGVGERAAGFDLGEYLRLRRLFENFKNPVSWLRVLKQHLPGKSADFEKYLDWTQALFRSVGTVAGTSYTVDASKNSLRALALLASPERFDVRLIHFVRDGRAVAWSASKPYKIDLKAGLEKELQPRPAWRTALFWLGVNLAAGLTFRFAKNKMLLRYEDLTTRAGEALGRVGQLAGLDFSETVAAISQGKPLKTEHIVAGNRLRMERSIRIAFNDDWRSNMPVPAQQSVARLAGWLLKKYGYQV